METATEINKFDEAVKRIKDSQFKGVAIIPATDTHKEIRYTDLAVLRNLLTIMQCIGFDFITLGDLIKFASETNRKPKQEN